MDYQQSKEGEYKWLHAEGLYRVIKKNDTILNRLKVPIFHNPGK